MLEEEVRRQIENCRKSVIVSHKSPDGDSIGSSLGFAKFLENVGHEVQVITPDIFPQFLKWMPGADQIINYEEDAEKCIQKIREAELIICLDFNSLQRLGDMAEYIKDAQAYTVNIDHHREPEYFADFNFINPEASSTCELVYQFIYDFTESKENIDQNVAACLYTGIVTDTGSFRFSSTSSNTHRIVADLIDTGIDNSLIYQNIFDNYSEDRIRLLGFALSENLKIYPELSTAIIHLSEADMNQFQLHKGDTEGLVNFPLSIATIKLAILLKEKEGQVRISFRSKGDFSVNELARKYFEGGGHTNAAGGLSRLSIEETLQKMVDTLKLYKNQLAKEE